MGLSSFEKPSFFVGRFHIQDPSCEKFEMLLVVCAHMLDCPTPLIWQQIGMSCPTTSGFVALLLLALSSPGIALFTLVYLPSLGALLLLLLLLLWATWIARCNGNVWHSWRCCQALICGSVEVLVCYGSPLLVCFEMQWRSAVVPHMALDLFYAAIGYCRHWSIVLLGVVQLGGCFFIHICPSYDLPLAAAGTVWFAYVGLCVFSLGPRTGMVLVQLRIEERSRFS
ncbi:hypothetical protein U1Q18_040238 [Sarracenia purpurea var. burkii]